MTTQIENYSLEDLLLFEPKDLRSLRHRNKLNQRFHLALISKDWWGGENEYRAAHIINEAYRLCAIFCYDDDPMDDPYFTYVKACHEKTDNEEDADLALMFFCIILEAYSDQGGKSPAAPSLDIFQFCHEIHRYIFDLENNIFWVEEIPAIKESSIVTDMAVLMDIQPCPPQNMICLANHEIVGNATSNYDQDCIREIISRFPTIDQQLEILNLILNAWNGCLSTETGNASSYVDTYLPF